LLGTGVKAKNEKTKTNSQSGNPNLLEILIADNCFCNGTIFFV